MKFIIKILIEFQRLREYGSCTLIWFYLFMKIKRKSIMIKFNWFNFTQWCKIFVTLKIKKRSEKCYSFTSILEI